MEDTSKLVLLGAAGSLDLAGHLRSASGVVLGGEAPPDAASAELALDYGCRRLSARTGDVGSLRALRQVVETALTGNLPTHWIWTREDGRFVDGLRPQVEPDGVESREELLFLRRAHHVALTDVLAMGDEVLLLLDGRACVIDAADGAAYPYAPEPGVLPPRGARLEVSWPDLEALQDDFAALHALLLGLNPRLVLRVAMVPAPVDALAEAEDFGTRLPALRQLSDLRVMMAHWQATLPNVGYLPLWELCTGPLAQSGHFAPVSGTLTPQGGLQVARLCLGQMAAAPVEVFEAKAPVAATRAEADERKARRARKRARRAERDAKPRDVICEEELLEAFSR